MTAVWWDANVKRYRNEDGQFASREEIEQLQRQITETGISATQLNAIAAQLQQMQKQLDKLDQTTVQINLGTQKTQRRLSGLNDTTLIAAYVAWFGLLLGAKLLLSTGIPQAVDDFAKRLNPDRGAQEGLAPLDSTPLKKGDMIGDIAISSGFGPRESPGGIGSTNHQGVDLPLDEGTPLRVPVDAQVECDYQDGGAGKYARIVPPEQTGIQFEFMAAHLSECNPGFYLVGQVFGKSGNTGASTGPHLHWAQKPKGGEWINPTRGFLERVMGVGGTVAVNPDAPLNDAAIQAMYGDFTQLSAPGIIGIGLAEGTLDSSGQPTMLYYGHTDPGNQAWNKGFGSWQATPVADASEGDRLAFERLKTQCIPDATKDAASAGIPLSPGLLAQICDMWIQAPLAADNAIANLKQCQTQGKSGDAAWLCMRVQSYYNPQTGQLEASGFGNNLDALTHDQNRRMQAVQDGMAKMPSVSAEISAVKPQVQAIATTTTTATPEQSVLKVQVGSSWGTCFVFKPSQCLTNAHVVGDAGQATLTTAYGATYRATVVKRGENGASAPDIAVLQIQGGAALPVIPAGTPQAGQSATLYGYPFGREFKPIAATVESISDRVIFRGNNEPGTSGGPLLVEGKWVGLNVAKSSRGSQAIQPSAVEAFINGH